MPRALSLVVAFCKRGKKYRLHLLLFKFLEKNKIMIVGLTIFGETADVLMQGGS